MKIIDYNKKIAKKIKRQIGVFGTEEDLRVVLDMLTNESYIPPSFHNHYFENRGIWDIHIKGDWVLLYEYVGLFKEDPRVSEDGQPFTGRIRLVDIGSHSQLFK